MAALLTSESEIVDDICGLMKDSLPAGQWTTAHYEVIFADGVLEASTSYWRAGQDPNDAHRLLAVHQERLEVLTMRLFHLLEASHGPLDAFRLELEEGGHSRLGIMKREM